MVVKYIQELRGKESDSIFFFMQIWSTENSSKYHGFCVLGGHMKMVIKLRRVYGLISKT
jgi:hypothetical protein